MELVEGRNVSLYYDSLIDFDIDKFPNRVNARHAHECMRNSDPYWYGPTCERPYEVLENAIIGDEELLEKYLRPKIEALDLEIDFKSSIQHIPTIKRKRIKTDIGDELDMQMVYQGKLDRAWTKTEKIEVDSQHHLITVLIDIGGNLDIRAIDTLWVAAACVKFCEDAEKAGKSIQIIVGGSASGATVCRKTATVAACIKRYNEPLNLERLAAMSHIGFYRSFGFVGKLASQFTLVGHLGYSESIHQNLPINLKNEIKEGHTKLITLNKALNKQGALQSLKNAIAQMKCI